MEMNIMALILIYVGFINELVLIFLTE